MLLFYYGFHLKNIIYPVYQDSEAKIDVMERFFRMLSSGISREGIKLSYDLFGMTFINTNDFGLIGIID